MSADFKRGFMLATGALVALYVVGVATGLLKKVV